MLKKIALVIVILVAAVLVYAATRPGSLHVERQATVNAPPERIFPLINDFHTWSSWSPYEKLDPAMKRTYSGSANGRGAVYELDFIEPFEGHNVAEFALVPQGAATNVKWTMDGPTPYLGKLMGVFVNMDTMIGRDFESGLANLKAMAEK